MKFLISPVAPELFSELEFKSRFMSPKGTHYSYEVDFQEDEMITITDRVGRSVPLDITEVEDLAEVLTRIVKYQQLKQKTDKILLNYIASGSE